MAAATVALRIGADLDDLLPGRAGEDTAFTVAFALLGLAALISGLDALRLHPSAGQALVEPARYERPVASDPQSAAFMAKEQRAKRERRQASRVRLDLSRGDLAGDDGGVLAHPVEER